MLPKSNSNTQPGTSPLSSDEAHFEEAPAPVQPGAAQPQDATDVEEVPAPVQPGAAQPEDATDVEEVPAPVQPGAAQPEDATTTSGVRSSSRTQLSAFTEVPAPSSLSDYYSPAEDYFHYQSRIRFYRRRAMNLSLLVGGASVILGAGALAFVITQPGIPKKSIWIIAICVAIALIMLYCVPTFLNARKLLRETPELIETSESDGMQAWAGAHERRHGSVVAQKGRDDARTNNQLLIDKYHELTTQQAATSYRNSQFAMAVGLILLVVGAVFAVRSTSGSAQLVVGVLTGLGATLSAYLGKTFIHTYERALLQMNYYFGQPLVTSYILEAERLSGKLSKDKRDDALSAIISETLLGASNASQALSPGTQDPASTRSSRIRRSVAKKDAPSTDNQS